jgi:hypothetical protein
LILAVPTDAPQTFLNWAQFGVLGLVVAGALFGWVWFKPAVDDLKASLAECRADLKEAREDLKRQGDLTREILVPAVVKSSELIQRVADEIWRLRGAA